MSYSKTVEDLRYSDWFEKCLKQVFIQIFTQTELKKLI